MPIHRIPRATYAEDILGLTRKEGERVVSVTLDGDEYVVVTELAVDPETREASWFTDALGGVE